ncbi:geranylgeranyl reductase family protein [Desertifilum sp. FACHB-1129]|uniref:NAD-binding protein n=1 Tax=Desertifilum tharense IPPAS B-1220 TaxID=1781255 RepID=A0A1E5QL04_9CYAN|nr:MULTISPECIES: geranylgeranyl reductase family protein [Desertifilum]MDA0211769.1 geranylgeranyl reductase family protein [Cyanobacteria bacterium FC1]MBD2311999.1 geranylgeranyl reductase family protein [Desertifilum sp. FACHB-1129]MBD2322451.1 geranylgeranyl reductase family protein [Desertifilum sp. FACHB-866]MBD2332614.1 geranylgeranyl reductase family protein [Desertifilum sp. FACHB-868]OEJ75308.1 NAD-binding protein [Desertifilum tharense IPPAS B-1220]
MLDCIIVGAGPAGSAAAYHLAKQGRSVLVVEKASLPRYKPCSGGVSPAIAQWFDFDFAPAISLHVTRLRYTWQLEDAVDAKLKDSQPMWVVRRDEFDRYLLQQAQQQGAQISPETTVTGIQFQGDHWQVSTNREPLTARYLIAADGANSAVSQWLGFKPVQPRPAGILEVQTEVSDPPVIHFDFGSIKNGFMWSFPKADGYSITAASFRGNAPKDLKSVLLDYAKSVGIDTSNSQYYEHGLAVWESDRPLHAQNALLVGEAACLVDPLSGEGIRPAILSGVKAAQAIDSALGGKASALEDYSAAIAEEWGADMAWAQKLAGAFYRFPGIGYKAAVKRPSATELMGKILCGQLRYGEVAGRALKRLSGGLLRG